MQNQENAIDPGRLTVFVTGATSGIGAVTARRFREAGSKVILAGRRRDRLDRAQDEWGCDRVHTVVLDVRDSAAVRQAVADLPGDYAEVDVLVASAGIALGLDPAQDADLEDWEAMVDTNVKGLMYCVRAFLPGMCARGRGHVISLGSIAGTYPYPGGNVYGATKAFVRQCSLNLRADLLGYNVRVTCIEPGRTETELALLRFKNDVEKVAALYRDVQSLQPGDVAEAVFWCATLPRHVNVNRLEVMPVMQAFGPMRAHKTAARA